MSKSILIAGGNSGIGLHVARTLASRGHHLTLLGRDAEKGNRALGSFPSGQRGQVRFVKADLSTHVGVREAAATLGELSDRWDAVVHTTGVLMTRDERTADGLHPMFAVSYLSRYHLTELLLPALRKSDDPRVVMMTAKVPVDTVIDYSDFPQYEPFNFAKMRLPIQVANHHYAAHLARTESGFSTAVINAGAAKTDIMRESPWYMRAGTAVLGPLVLNSIEKSAYNVVEAVDGAAWKTAAYWNRPGNFDQRTPIDLEATITDETVRRSADIVGTRPGMAPVSQRVSRHA
ncbi:NAD(P)-dependent dehydrogenase (short-subunit alcohol dehydrogenase family) [Pseudarthrobacter oxydans]|uniref:NAD(P)-dependent dehydrogenase (Short-subunit alcohol dehydrogenase family) n=1 Tax=Pseudarthrobacter oxydans TaxID=1671 RepID=A0AAW8NI07_PSEOX|nr:SDR family NAD(P)-dependent oxidoreductase [Pseudarthrobacter oxydans]MDR7165737.1 NAD(P)-dependent dehydrogenase (short-subunit alcohol dehydrogenase family) [Pseudarthrobacter oxydans]